MGTSWTQQLYIMSMAVYGIPQPKQSEMPAPPPLFLTQILTLAYCNLHFSDDRKGIKPMSRSRDLDHQEREIEYIDTESVKLGIPWSAKKGM